MDVVLMIVAIPVLGYIGLRLMAAVNREQGRSEVGDRRHTGGRRAAFTASALWHRLRGD